MEPSTAAMKTHLVAIYTGRGKPAPQEWVANSRIGHAAARARRHTHGGARGGGGSQQARERGTRVTSTRATTSECATTSDECAAQSFARALRAYHGTLSPRWGPTSDQCEIVRARAARLPWNARPPVGLSPTSSGSVPAPSSRPIQERAASCSSPPTQPPRCGAAARSEKINLAVGQKSTSR